MEYLRLQQQVVISLFAFLTTLSLSSSSSSSSSSPATQYKVGDSVWSIPPTPNYYSNWSSRHHFLIHDSLWFEFETGSHNVMQVSKLDYDACSAANPFRAYRAGPVKIRLIEKGVLYFICNVSDYCLLGQKVKVAIDDRPGQNATTNPSSSPAPSPKWVFPPPVSPTTSPESGPSSRPGQSNRTLRQVFLVLILMVVVSVVVCT